MPSEIPTKGKRLAIMSPILGCLAAAEAEVVTRKLASYPMTRNRAKRDPVTRTLTEHIILHFFSVIVKGLPPSLYGNGMRNIN